MKLQRSYMGEHLKSECEYRNVKCDFCRKDVAFASMEVRIEYHIVTNCFIDILDSQMYTLFLFRVYKTNMEY